MIRQTRYLLALTILALSACHYSSSNLIQIPNSNFSIINGERISASDWIATSTVALYDDYMGQFCSGVLIEDNIVLTAAHCIGPSMESMQILFGLDVAYNASATRAVTDYKVSPYWDTRKYQKRNTGDIALVKFAGSLPTGFKPASILPTEKKDLLSANTAVIVAGFGAQSSDTQTASGILYKAKLEISDSQFSISEILLDQSQGSSVCHGDSGGPAFILFNGQTYLWGITSRGVNDTEKFCNQSVAYTSAVYYSTWIRRMIVEMHSSLLDR